MKARPRIPILGRPRAPTESSFALVPGQNHVWNHVKKPIIFLVSGALVATTAIGAGAYSVAHKTVNLDIDGETTSISTFKGDVAGLLEENNIVLADGDLVVPSVNSVLRDDSEVVVRYQREVTLERDGEKETLKTTALDADELLNGFSSRGSEVALVASRSRGQERVEIGLTLNQDGPVALLIDGKNTILEEGHGEVADIIRSQGIVLGDEDRISIRSLPIGVTTAEDTENSSDKQSDEEKAAALRDRSETADAASYARALDGEAGEIVTLVIERVETKESTKSSKIKFESETVKDDDRFEDLGKLVKTKGKNGEKVTTYETVTVNGVQESRTKISEEVVSEPVTEVIVIGTKERPKPKVVEPKAASSSGSGSSGGSSKGSSDKSNAAADDGFVPSGVWAKLAQCESSGNPSVVSSNGLYHGLYQFSVSTWKSVGGSGLPSQASASEQTKRAKMLQARSGWGQWPHCSSKLGLR